MLWNLGIHIIAGLFGANIFTWTGVGIMTCVIITCVVQGIDMFRIYHTTMKRINQQPPDILMEQKKAFRKRMLITFPQLFVMKVIGYGLITLATASIVRAF
ncbi:MAG: hypothetical protein SCARUB_02583 [Candidatus Scalindua rubra]|uniref:Uncharacterized protein n=1 Tax=Candidatus Scalindua rubra TaxID=1872076 RepID=A0A1E3X9I1_9BACT|nr:MAG: hypothetical protein SCARUB_02583 [Candidatus Scalindua rubra]